LKGKDKTPQQKVEVLYQMVKNGQLYITAIFTALERTSDTKQEAGWGSQQFWIRQ
jgi:hypothetical protein